MLDVIDLVLYSLSDCDDASYYWYKHCPHDHGDDEEEHDQDDGD